MKTFIFSIVRGLSWKEVPWILCFLLLSYIVLSKTIFSQEPEVRVKTKTVTETVVRTDTVRTVDTLIVYREVEILVPEEPDDNTQIYNVDVSDTLIEARIRATVSYPMTLSNLDFEYKPLFPIEIKTTETQTTTVTETKYVTEYERRRMLGVGGAVGVAKDRSLYLKPSIYYFSGSATFRLSYDYSQNIIWLGTEIPIL